MITGCGGHGTPDATEHNLSAGAKEAKTLEGAHRTVIDYFDAAHAAFAPTNKVVKQYSINGVKVDEIELTSQNWPLSSNNAQSKPPFEWQHRLIRYRPTDMVAGAPALLYVAGGSNQEILTDGGSDWKDAAVLAESLGMEIAVLTNVPNQPLPLDGASELTEDELIAESWQRYMADPVANRFASMHLPMAYSIKTAMDYLDDGQRHFVLAGASKRGWAAWLTTLNDTRVDALIPIVTDFWNIPANFEHIRHSYDGKFPPALAPYENRGLEQLLKPQDINAASLLAFEDPVRYPAEALARPTVYMISAMNDEFTVPDSAWQFLPKLGAHRRVRYLLNESHAVGSGRVISAMTSFLRHFVAGNKPRPQTVAYDADTGQVTWNIPVIGKTGKVRVWVARNKFARDFRLDSDIYFSSRQMPVTCTGDTCQLSFTPDKSVEGWQAYFIEAELDGVETSTPPLIWPRRYADGSAAPDYPATLPME
ncbi:MAG: PhoPQ-activated protein PqaA family protein [Janthinobacterium lividum]